MTSKELEGLLGFWNSCSGIATLVLAAGILGEYAVPIFLKEEVNKPLWRRVLSILCVLLVVGGIVGEYWAGSRISEIAGRLQRISDGEVAAANERAAKAEERAAEANKEAANRDLTPEEMKAISSRLSAFSGQRATIDVFPVTFEHVAIASEIEGVLLGAHWKVRGYHMLPAPANVRVSSNGTGFPGPFLVQGINIHATADEPSQSAATALFEALKPTAAPGNLMRGVPLDNPENPRVWIYVGDKPTPLRSWVK